MGRTAEGRRRMRRLRRGGALLVLAVFALAFLLGLLQGGTHGALLDGGEALLLREGWTDGEGRPVEIPGMLPWNGGEKLTLTTILPETAASGETYLLFKARYLNAALYLDGELLGTCQAKPDGAANSMGDVYKWFPLPEDCGGGELRLEAELLLGPGMTYRISAPILGSRWSILSMLLKDELLLTLLDLAILCFSALLLVFGICNSPMLRRRDFLYTGELAAAFACYSLCTGNLVHMFCTDSYLIYLLEFLLLAALPVPIVASIRQLSGRVARKAADVELVLLTGNLVLQLALHLFTPLELRNTVFLTHTLILVVVVTLAPIILSNWKRGRQRWMMATYFFLAVGTMADMGVFYLLDDYRSPVFMAAGMLVCIAIQTGVLVSTYLKYYERTVTSRIYRRMAYTDALTGLGNRAAFEQRIKMLRRDQDKHTSLWCVCADINNLKLVNDTRGHTAGDKLICAAAAALKSALGERAWVYRTGGDEFVAFLVDCGQAEVEKNMEAFQREMEAFSREEEIPLEAAWGYDCYRREGDTISELILRSDQNMYASKRAWKEEQNAPDPKRPAGEGAALPEEENGAAGPDRP